ncbi:phosphopyruvate hydratase [Parasphingopyxis lamellibrachiae]|uniref:Enolase n=1 Tax=Parasphingopyxis lamellibrachiae TaxID=680125 RepID=A0A3D9FHT5_9SPHN|nr:phosphopyruvate hydratase [Parasphingopyxis lamellibrachiae]RED17350.1 enolase [Parasphingopyxis lamellibrachiae]
MKTGIASVFARQIWDSRGCPTVEAEVTLASGASGRAAAPAGASRGEYEAIDLRDGGIAFGGKGVGRAVDAVNGPIAKALQAVDARDQALVDSRMIEGDGTSNKSVFGGNATVAVSMAVAHAVADAEGLPLWRLLAGDRHVRIPLPEIQIFGGGAHAGRRTDVQDFMIMAPQAGSIRRALEITGNVYHAAGAAMEDAGLLAGTADEGGWWPNFDSNEAALSMLVSAIERAGYRPGEDVFISLDIAANELRSGTGYQLNLDGEKLSSDEIVDRVVRWSEDYPILSVEDPVGQDDTAGMANITARIGETVQIIGDDFLVTDAGRVAKAAEAAAGNAVLVKVNQAGTLTEARAALETARELGWATIVSARSGETEDVTIAHLATGWNAGQIKVGSFARSERMAKWNELLRIEEALGSNAEFAGAGGLPRRVGKEKAW